MKMYIYKTYLITLLLFVIMDGVWLYFATPYLYGPKLGHLMGSRIVWTAVILFYLLYSAGAMFFVINLHAGNPYDLFVNGAILGILCYGTYELTNQAIMLNWQWSITIIDMLWGAFMTATVCLISGLLCKK